jgi:hypothetical protein
MSEEKDKTHVTPIRIQRVESYIMNDPALKALVKGRKDYAVKGRGGKTTLFHNESVAVVEAIRLAGQDAYNYPKNDILRIAKETLSNGSASAEPETKEAKPETKAEETAAPSDKPNPKKSEPRFIKSSDPSLAIISLLLSADQIAEHDKHPNAAARRKKLRDVLNEYTEQTAALSTTK